MTLEDQIIAIELPYSRGEFLNEGEYLRYKEGFDDAKRLAVEFWSCAPKDKQALSLKSPFKMFAKDTLEKYNNGLISADEYYKAIADAKLLMC